MSSEIAKKAAEKAHKRGLLYSSDFIGEVGGIITEAIDEANVELKGRIRDMDLDVENKFYLAGVEAEESKMKELMQTEVDEAWSNVVWGFYENGPPFTYMNTDDANEVCSPVTVEEVKGLAKENAELAMDEVMETIKGVRAIARGWGDHRRASG